MNVDSIGDHQSRADGPTNRWYASGVRLSGEAHLAGYVMCEWGAASSVIASYSIFCISVPVRSSRAFLPVSRREHALLSDPHHADDALLLC